MHAGNYDRHETSIVPSVAKGLRKPLINVVQCLQALVCTLLMLAQMSSTSAELTTSTPRECENCVMVFMLLQRMSPLSQLTRQDGREAVGAVVCRYLAAFSTFRVRSNHDDVSRVSL